MNKTLLAIGLGASLAISTTSLQASEIRVDCGSISTKLTAPRLGLVKATTTGKCTGNTGFRWTINLRIDHREGKKWVTKSQRIFKGETKTIKTSLNGTCTPTRGFTAWRAVGRLTVNLTDSGLIVKKITGPAISSYRVDINCK